MPEFINGMEVLTAEEVAEWFKVKVKTVKNYSYRKKIPRIRIGEGYRFPKLELEKWLNDRKEMPKQYDFSRF